MTPKTHAQLKLSMTAIIIASIFAIGGVSTWHTANASNLAASYHTYVIHTYGGANLLPSVRQTLASYGGSASVYQDKLVLRTTPAGYQAVQDLLTQIDGEPQSLTVSVKVGNQTQQTGSIGQGQIILSNQGIGGYGRFGNTNTQTHASNLYQINTLSGSSTQIGTGTLVSLAQPYMTTIYDRYGQPSYRITVLGQVLAHANQGIAVTPRLLPNQQVQLNITQAHDTIQNTGSANTRYGVSGIQTQSLNTTLNVTRGQWVTVGSVSQSTASNATGYGGYRQSTQTTQMPIQIRVD